MMLTTHRQLLACRRRFRNMFVIRNILSGPCRLIGRKLQLVPRCRLILLLLLAAVTCIFYVIIMTLPPGIVPPLPLPRYVRVGSDQHRSVFGLTEPDVEIIATTSFSHRLAYSNSSSYQLRSEQLALFVVVAAGDLDYAANEASNWTSQIRCFPGYIYRVYLIVYRIDNITEVCSDDVSDEIRDYNERTVASVFPESRPDAERVDVTNRCWSPRSTPTSSEKTIVRQMQRSCLEQVGDDARAERRRTESVNVWIARVRVGVSQQGGEAAVAAVVADLVVEEYVANASWYDIHFLYNGHNAAASVIDHHDASKQCTWPESCGKKSAASPLDLLSKPTDSRRLQFVGAEVVRYGIDRTRRVGILAEIVFHRTQMEIFGHSWPPSLETVDDIVSYMVLVFSTRKPSLEVTCSRLWNATATDREILARYESAVLKSFNRCLRCYLDDKQSSDIEGNGLSLDNDNTVDDNRNDDVGRNGFELRQRVVSMVLYGNDSRYTMGAIRNAQLFPVIFPGWRLRFYVEQTPPLPTYSDADFEYQMSRHSPTTAKQSSVSLLRHKPDSLRQLVLDRLTDLGVELINVDPASFGTAEPLAPMLWRFLIVDDPSVDVFLSRDADSRLSDRDASAVNRWLDRLQLQQLQHMPSQRSQIHETAVNPMIQKVSTSSPMLLESVSTTATFHCIRDHPSHGNFPVNGGMWGAVRRPLAILLGLDSANKTNTEAKAKNSRVTTSISVLLSRYGSNYMDDMKFLESEVWSRLTASGLGSSTLCHDSVSCDRWPGSTSFPVIRRGSEHVGQVFDAWSRPRKGDVDLLTAAPRNQLCEPRPDLAPNSQADSCNVASSAGKLKAADILAAEWSRD